MIMKNQPVFEIFTHPMLFLLVLKLNRKVPYTSPRPQIPPAPTYSCSLLLVVYFNGNFNL